MVKSEIMMLRTMRDNGILSNVCIDSLTSMLLKGGQSTEGVQKLIYKVWRRRFWAVQKYEQVVARDVKYILSDEYKRVYRARNKPKPKSVDLSHYVDIDMIRNFKEEILDNKNNGKSGRILLEHLKRFNIIYDYTFFLIRDNHDGSFTTTWEGFYNIKKRIKERILDLKLKREVLYLMEWQVMFLTDTVRELRDNHSSHSSGFLDFTVFHSPPQPVAVARRPRSFDPDSQVIVSGMEI